MQINAWLKAGIFDQGEVIFPTEGTPQGSIISPLLANVALNGLQEHIATNMKKLFDFNQAKNVYFIRYADDFVVLAPTRETIQFAKVLCIQYLAFYGLEMKEEATRIIYTLLRSGKNTIKSEYFDFLGFRFKQRYLSKHTLYFEAGKTTQTRTLVLVNPKRIERHKASISALMKKIGTTKELISQLNPRIIGWCNYFQTSDAKFYGDLPRKMDLWLNAKIRKWIRRTAKLRGKTEKYWKKESKDWILYYQDKNGIETTLVKYNSFRWSIYDYRAIPADFTPYKLNYKDIRTLSLL